MNQSPSNNLEGNKNRAIQGDDNDAVQGNDNQIVEGNGNQTSKTDANINLSNGKMDFQSSVNATMGNVQRDVIVNLNPEGKSATTFPIITIAVLGLIAAVISIAVSVPIPEITPPPRPERFSDAKAVIETRKEPHSTNEQAEPPAGVDYSKLEDLLAGKDWQKANEETWGVILQAAGRKNKNWLRVEDIKKIPCDDLRTIDRLWAKYSDGRFGFSVQKDIYQELGGTREYDEKIWRAFGDRVGWRQGGNWLSDDELNWAKNSPGVSPRGHLPVTLVLMEGRNFGERTSSFAQKLVECSK